MVLYKTRQPEKTVTVRNQPVLESIIEEDQNKQMTALDQILDELDLDCAECVSFCYARLRNS